MAKKSKPQSLKALLFSLLALVILGGAAIFYFAFNYVQDYSVQVNHRLLDADASGTQIERLQLLKAQLSQSQSLIGKADALFSSPANYQAQALNDLKNYANQTGLSISATSFDDPTSTGIYSMTLKLADPVNYTKLIQFLDLIEGNLPKMQVSSINLMHKVGGDANDVEVGDIKINISVR